MNFLEDPENVTFSEALGNTWGAYAMIILYLDIFSRDFAFIYIFKFLTVVTSF